MRRRDFIKLGALWVPATAFGGVSYLPHRRKAFQPVAAGGGDTAWVTSTPATAWRNNFDGCVGSLFTTDATARTITALGLYVKSGNTASVTVRILNGATEITSTIFDQTGMSEGWNYISVTPVPLPTSAHLAIAREAVNGGPGDNWPDEWTITTSGIASLISSAYNTTCADVNNFQSNAAGKMYAAVNFKYTTP